MAFSLGDLGKAQDTLNQGKGAVSSGQQAVTSGQEAVNSIRQGVASRNAGGPMTPAPVSKDEGGVVRLIPVLSDTWVNAVRAGTAQVGLLERGTYFVQRQGAYAAPAQGQVLLTPRSNTTTWSMELPSKPSGMVFDLASGRNTPAGRGVRIYALSLHADVPQRRNRQALDAIEQHAMLRASSVQMEWPLKPEDILEAVGGKLLVYATEAGVAFPSGFGADGKLFTPDDPMASLPQGYSVVTLDRQGFSFDRSREVVIPFHNVLPPADVDLSRLSYADAFQAFTSWMNLHYPYQGPRPVDWGQISSELASAVGQAGSRNDAAAYAQVYAGIAQRLGDGLLNVRLPDGSNLRNPARLPDWGLSPQRQQRGDFVHLAPRVWLGSDGRAWVSDVPANSPAMQAGLKPGAEITEIDGQSLSRYLEGAVRESGQGTDAARRLDALELSAYPKDSLRIRVRQDGQEQQLDMRRVRDGVAPPVSPNTVPDASMAAYRLRSAKGLDYGYIAFNTFADANGKLENWERMLAQVNQARMPGLIVDLRSSTDGSYQLVPHFAASFFSYDKPLRLQTYAQRQLDPASRVWRVRGGLGLPPQLPLFSQNENRYGGKLVLLTGRDCSGACELFAAWLQQAGRAQVVAAEGTAGKVGHTTRVNLPGGVTVQAPVLAELRNSGESYVSGKGIVPDQWVPVDSAFVQRLASGGDPVLDAAVRWLDGQSSTR